jgi:predicted RND superfamily exporter protein
MWGNIAGFVLRFRLLLLTLLIAATAFMGYHASKVQLSYEFARAVPIDNPKYVAYQNFKKTFGEDGNLLVIGVQTDKLFEQDIFNDYVALNNKLKKITGVESVLSVPYAVNLIKKIKEDSSQTLMAVPVFRNANLSQQEIDSSKKVFFNLIFYRGLLYNAQTNTYLIAVNVNRDIMASARRTITVKAINDVGDEFGSKHNIEMHYSGLPFIRTNMAVKIANEMKVFLVSSILLSALILLLFFRSFSTMFLSLAVVLIGVIWSLGTMDLFGYKITLLSGVIPPLVVVIGIPNCIYFLNKFHTSYNETRDKKKALYEMIRKMGIVTLFCNITAAIGFGVFALTKSAILNEFGVVAGINIMMLFFISFILIPGVLSYLPDPKEKHTRYLKNKWLTSVLNVLEKWTLNHQKTVYAVTAIVLIISVIGITKIKSEGFVVDDLPKTDRMYKDLKFFEANFRGVMPLEIVIDTKRKNGLRINPLQTFDKIDQLSKYIEAKPNLAKPLSIVEGLKFVRQAYYEGDSSSYGLPNQFDISFLAAYLNTKPNDSSNKKNNFLKLVNSFIDSNKQQTRISVNMMDVGTIKLPLILNDIEKKSAQLFDSSKYKIVFTGSSVTYLEGSNFIIKGLQQSILYAFILIAICMLYLFKSLRILLCSLIPNMIPLVITAGVMGWVGVSLKPSTVLVFSIALGIAIDITIRFLVNYKQELANGKADQKQTVINTIHTTGISIIYTSLVLIAGFGIFCFSGFGGTKALGWLTSLTLIIATLTNLIFLPTLLITLGKKKQNA